MVGTFSPRKEKQNKTKPIVGICLIVVSLILLFTTFLPFTKPVGKFFIGTFGITFYAILAAIILFGTALILKAKYKFSCKYIVYNVIVFLVIASLLHLMINAKSFELNFNGFVKYTYNSWTVGGLTLGLLAYGIKLIASMAGAYIVYIICGTVFVALIIDYRHAFKQFMRIKQKNASFQKDVAVTDNIEQNQFKKPEVNDVKIKQNLIESEPTLITINSKQRQREELSKEELEKRLEGNSKQEDEDVQASLEKDRDVLRRILGLKKDNENGGDNQMTSQMLKDYMRAPKTVTLAPSLEAQKAFLHATNIDGNSQLLPKTDFNLTANLNDTINSTFAELRNNSSLKQNSGLDFFNQNNFEGNSKPAKIFDSNIKPIINGDSGDLKSNFDKNNFSNNIENKTINDTFSSSLLNSRRRDRSENVILNNSNIFDDNIINKQENAQNTVDNNEQNNVNENKDSSISDIIDQIKRENSNIISSKFNSNLDEEKPKIIDNLSQQDNIIESDIEENSNNFASDLDTDNESDNPNIDCGFIPDVDDSETGDSEFDFNERQDEIIGSSKETEEEELEPEIEEEQEPESELVSNFKKNFVDASIQKQESVFDMEIEKTEKVEPNFGNYSSYNYIKPSLELLKDYDKNRHNDEDEEYYKEKAHILEETLANFNIPVRVVAFTRGPAVTRYELQMAPGISVKKIQAHESDIAMSLESRGNIRIEAPIPGKNAVGVEIPNREIATIGLKEVISTPQFIANNHLCLGLGKDVSGETIMCNIDEMPHLLIAGSTGSGKSVCLNSLLVSLLYKHSPADLRIILIDPKRVEFGIYSGIPHLITPEPVTEPKEAINSLKWAVEEMERRYQIFHEAKVNSISSYNNRAAVKNGEDKKLPNIVIVIDELANLIMLAKRDVEENVKRLTSLARASGIYLVVATQRPSVDVITGTIKVNIPSRIAFMVTNGADSKTILDQYGAENLLGKGDMLYAPQNYSEPKRVQCSFVSLDEIKAVVEFIKNNNESYFDEELTKAVLKKEEPVALNNEEDAEGENIKNKFDKLLPDALKLAIENRAASITMIQRRFSVGFNRAGRIIDQMELAKFISPSDGSKSRSVYLTMDEYNSLFGNK